MEGIMVDRVAYDNIERVSRAEGLPHTYYDHTCMDKKGKLHDPEGAVTAYEARPGVGYG